VSTGDYVAARTPETQGFVNRAMWIDQLHYLPDDILYKCDRMSMAHSLEVRPPFLDHRIVEFAARLPEHFKVNGSKLKFILKDLVKDKLPQSILTRKKQGFDIPTHHWLRTSLKPLFMDTVNRESINATGILEWGAIDRVIGDHMSRRANYGYHLWGLLILCSWMKRWKIHG
jgi:asparagine synthase (glutamine-hydrolysing)